jgi:hypothetical protein
MGLPITRATGGRAAVQKATQREWTDRRMADRKGPLGVNKDKPRGKTAQLRDKSVIPYHRAEIAKLYVQGKPLNWIAGEMGLPLTVIKDDLRVIHKEWANSALADFDKRKMEEAAHISAIEFEMWEAWEKSKRPRRLSHHRITSGKWGGNESYIEMEDREGNPYFMDLALKCVDRRIKLFGLDAPEKSINLNMDMVKVYKGFDLDEV